MPRSPLFRKLIVALQTARRVNRAAAGLSTPIPHANTDRSRRRFLQASASLAGAALAANALPVSIRSAWAAGTPPRIAVIGAGLAGLTAGYRLQQAGVDVTVYEASGRLGGRVHTVTGAVGEGLVTDLGAELINLNHTDMLALAQEFGLELFDRRQDAAGRTVPMTAYYFDGAAVGEAQLAKDLEPLAAQIAADAELLDADYDTHAARLDRISVARYLRLHADKIPAPYVKRLIENSIRTEFGVEPARSSALQLIFNLPTVDGEAVEVLSESDETYAVVGGSQGIVDGLAGALSGRIETRRRLTAIRRRGHGYRLHFARGGTADADVVIVAIPFTVLRGVELAVPLPAGFKRYIRQARLGSNEKLIAGFKRRFWLDEGGFGAEAFTDLEFPEVWDCTQRQPERSEAALNFFLGGRQARTAGRGSAQTLGGEFVTSLGRILPGAAAESNGRFLRTGWSRNPYSRGAYTSFQPGQLTRFAEHFWIESSDPAQRQEVYAGRLVFAGEHVSDEFYGFMNGAAQTGRLSAELVLRWIGEGLVAQAA